MAGKFNQSSIYLSCELEEVTQGTSNKERRQARQNLNTSKEGTSHSKEAQEGKRKQSGESGNTSRRRRNLQGDGSNNVSSAEKSVR